MSDVLRDVRDLMEQHARVRVYDGQRRSVRAEGEVIGYCPAPMLIIRRDDGTLAHESSELPRDVMPIEKSERHDKERKEQTHRDRLHADVAPDTDEMCARMVSEHDTAQAVVVEAIVAVARLNNGQVDPNAVRQILPRDLNPPQIVGAVYRLMKMLGGLDGHRLVEIGEVVSEDKRGGNAGKPLALYKLVAVEERRTG